MKKIGLRGIEAEIFVVMTTKGEGEGTRVHRSAVREICITYSS